MTTIVVTATSTVATPMTTASDHAAAKCMATVVVFLLFKQLLFDVLKLLLVFVEHSPPVRRVVRHCLCQLVAKHRSNGTQRRVQSGRDQRRSNSPACGPDI